MVSSVENYAIEVNEVFEVLHEHFGEGVIGLGTQDHVRSGIDWPPYSPDLNPCDDFYRVI